MCDMHPSRECSGGALCAFRCLRADRAEATEPCGAFDNWRSSLRGKRSFCERPKGHSVDGATCDAKPAETATKGTK